MCKGTVTSDGINNKDYTGLSRLTEGTFKYRHLNYLSPLRREKYEHATELSNYAWRLKRAEKPFNTHWTIHRKAPAYSDTTKRCALCLAENNSPSSPQKESPHSTRDQISILVSTWELYLLVKFWFRPRFFNSYHLRCFSLLLSF